MYDSIIIGGGPGGLTAALYLARAKRRVLLIERIPGGGQTGAINEVFNYPGVEKISGYDLLAVMQAQAVSFGAETLTDEVTELDAHNKTVKTLSGRTLSAKTLIVATGCTSRTLGLPGEAMLSGRGVSYCATCDGNFYKGRTVAVVGNSEKAAADAEYLSGLAKTFFVSEKGLTAEGAITVTGSVTALVGAPLNKIEVTAPSGEKIEIDCDCLFVSVGFNPVTGLLAGKVERDGDGFVVTDEKCETSVKGVFAVGDIRAKSLRQIVTAAADGAIAAQRALSYR